MRTTVRHRQTFNAAHTAPSWLCGKRLHGHDWFAECVVVGEPDKDTGTVEVKAWPELSALVDGLDKESLDVVLPGVHPTAEGLAAWLLEQLRMSTPGLVSVTVGFTGHAATVEV